MTEAPFCSSRPQKYPDEVGGSIPSNVPVMYPVPGKMGGNGGKWGEMGENGGKWGEMGGNGGKFFPSSIQNFPHFSPFSPIFPKSAHFRQVHGNVPETGISEACSSMLIMKGGGSRKKGGGF